MGKNIRRIVISPGTGHAIAQEVSLRLPTAAARVGSCGICGGQSGTWIGFLGVLRFSLRIVPPNQLHRTLSAGRRGLKSWPGCRLPD
jgi:hypothetical protein